MKQLLLLSLIGFSSALAQCPDTRITATSTIRSQQYASSVIGFSSEFSNSDYSAAQALGTPDVYPMYGDDPMAWKSATPDGQREYLELGFDSAQFVDFIRIYETFNTGAVDSIYLRDSETLTWNLVNQTDIESGSAESRVFKIYLDQTPFKADAIRLAINSPGIAGFNQIDAVSITGNVYFKTEDDISVCEQMDVTLTVTGATSYFWEHNGSTDSSVFIIPFDTAQYVVHGTSNGCEVTDTFNLNVIPSPPVQVSTNGTTICPGESVSLTYVGNLEFVWRPSISDTVLTVSPTSSTEVTIIVLNEDQCYTSKNYHIHVLEAPELIVTAADQTVCIGGTADIEVSGGVSYLWSTGSTDTMVTVTVDTDTTFSVIGTSYDGCQDTAYVSIQADICSGMEEEESKVMIYPNPSRGQFTLTRINNVDDLQLFSITGKAIPVVCESSSATVTGLSAGVYILKLTYSNNKPVIKRIVIE